MSVKLSAAAASLMTEEGYLNALASIYEDLARADLTRDQVSSLIGARRCLAGFADARKEKEFERSHKELLSAHTKTQELISQQQGTGTTSFDSERLQIPRKPISEPTEN